MFKIFKNDGAVSELKFKEFSFPAGEVSVKLDQNFRYKSHQTPFQTIIARLHNGDDVMKLFMLVDALRRFDATPIRLALPYIPYGRQDRVCDKGESLSVKVFGNMINSLNFEKVTILDPHSDVTGAVIDRCEIETQLGVINRWPEFINVAQRSVLVAPDIGSVKKTSELASYFNHDSFIRADKLRDLSTGKIKEIVVYTEDLKGRDVVVPDDILEKCNTFIGLVKALKQKNVGKVILYGTHGIFGGISNRAKVIDNVLNSGIDEIWTTNSYHGDEDFAAGLSGKIKVLDVDKFLI